MTDREDTNQDLQMTLAQIEDTLAQAANPAALFDGAKAHLGALYNNAEAAGDNAAMIAINESWNHVQALAQSAQANREAYLTAKDIAGTFQTQRDDALEELKELTEAVEHVDTDHPLVSELVEYVEEAINEQESYWIDDSLAESVYEHLTEAFGYDKEALERIEVFTDIFWGNIEIQPARKREFFAWLDTVKADAALESADDEDGDDDE